MTKANNIMATEQVKESTIRMWIKANEESLINQSRSFAIPILNLDNRFMIPIMVEYNLNKAIDTIEDSMALEVDEKIDLISTFCEHLERGRFSPEVQKRMLEITPKEEAFIFKNYESMINLFNTLSKEEKALAKKWTMEMAKGMCDFLTRPINILKDLNEYCYYVAGTVGLYLTHLLRLKGSNLTEKGFSRLEAHAVPFALFLQKLNIIRDFVEDTITKKRNFWPQTYSELEEDPVGVLNHMCHESFQNDLPHAIEYYKAIPVGNDSYDYFIRFILSSGMEYLKILKNNRSIFSRIKVKLPKMFIRNLYSRVSSQTREEFKAYCEQFHAEEMKSYYTTFVSA